MSLLTEINIAKNRAPQRFCETKDLREKEEQAEKSLLFCKTKEQDQKALLRRGAPGEARTRNGGVGGLCFIQLDYGCVFLCA